MTSFSRLLVWSATAVMVLLTSLRFPQEATAISASSDSKHGPTVKAPAGDVEGLTEGDLLVFKGIPYALPSVGLRRWRASDPMPRWTNVRKATDFIGIASSKSSGLQAGCKQPREPAGESR
jgi:hypothetical protein